MEKRTILAVLLIFFVFWLSNQLLWRPSTEQDPQTFTQQPLEQVPADLAEVREGIETVYPDEPGYRTPDEIIQAETVRDNITLENEDVIISFTNRGAVINSIRLKNYYMPGQTEYVELIPPDGRLLNVTLDTVDERKSLDNLVFDYEYSEDGYGLTFFIQAAGEPGLRSRRVIIRDFYLNDQGYTLHLDQVFDQYRELYGYDLKFDTGIADTEENVSHRNQDYKVSAQVSNAVNTTTLGRLREPRTYKGTVNWAAVRSKYFVKGIIPNERINTIAIDMFKQEESPAFNFTVRNQTSRMRLEDSYLLYLGPLLYSELQALGVGMEETVEMGAKIIRPLSRLFLFVLTNLNRLIPNYGFVIIIFAFFLKIVLSPLTKKSQETSHKMQRVNPHMKEIQRKYKSDPKKMNMEMKKLYKEHGVNPLGGCLPLLLQMPIFFALFPVLRYSIEIRQAHFMLWLRDLSEPDPYLILPILMGIFMFVQQKMMMPATSKDADLDDKQKAAMQSQKMMMYIMPVFMVFIFRGLPSGLVLYWTTFNVFSIIQQYFLLKKIN